MADTKMVMVGPWGGSGGEPWEFITDGKITGIKIRSGDVVDAISFTFKDQSGTNHESSKFGGDDGTLRQIHFAHDEELIKVDGRFGEYGDLIVVTSLTFLTNRNIYGPYGKYGGLDFSTPVTEGRIIGFFGRCGDLLDSIGAILSS